MMYFMPLAAVALDWIVGDPRSRFHPVALIGRLIAALEKLLLNPADAPGRKRWRGALLALTVLAAVYAIGYGATAFLAAKGRWIEFAGGALLLSFAISPRSLAAAGREIRDCLEQGDLARARYKVGWIVGRDTERLDVSEVARATVETIAENIVDGIIAPLFFFLVGGVPLACLYRAVNTLDSMLGYKNDKYIDFGMAAARTDDVFNFIPARLTAGLIVASAFLLGLDYRAAAAVARRDARKHPSPNSGYSEAAVAGALGVRLGGLNYYFGRPSRRAYMGDATRALAPAHITQTIKIMYLATLLFAGLAALAGLLIGGS